MSEDIVPAELSAASATEGANNDESTSLAQNGSASVTSYQSIETAASVGTGPVRYVMSGIKPSLSYLETIGICLLTLIVPVLLDPVIGSKPTESMNHFLVHALSITVAYFIAAFVCGLFAELHHYHNNDSGGIVSVASTVSGSVMSYLAIAATMIAVIFQVSNSVTRLSDLLDRQFEYSFTDAAHNWSVKVSMLTLLLVLLIFLASLLGVLVISRIGTAVAILSYCFAIVAAGYGIHHKRLFDDLHISTSTIVTLEESHSGDYDFDKGVSDHESSVFIDASLHSYIMYLINTISQMVVINLLLPLTEDNKLEKYRINIIGSCVFAAVFFASLFMNLALAHITSDADVFIDQAGLTMGMPNALVAIISGVVGLAALCRGVLILYSVSRVMCHVVVRREEAGNNFRPCKMLKLPMFVNGIQCLIVAGTLFIRKEDITQFALVSLFIYICIGALCHALHRYASSECETTPVIESMGSLHLMRTIKILLTIVVVSSLALCISDIVADYIELPTYVSKQIYAVVRIFLALIVIGAVSVLASFQQIHGIAGVYRWLVWTPLIPCATILLSCVTVVYNWYWGAILSAVTLLLAANVFAFDRLAGRFCCAATPQTADDVSHE